MRGGQRARAPADSQMLRPLTEGGSPMRVCRTSILARRLARLTLLASALPLLAAAALAQSQGRSPRDATMRQRNAEMMREIDIRRRDGTVKEAKPEETPHPILPYARAKEDFRTLQLVNNDMMRAVFATAAAGPTDYERVAEAAAEIGKRAARLRSNLRLPDQAQVAARASAPDISDDGQLRSSLHALDKAIMEFVTNPGFRQSGTVDVRHSTAAAESLTRVTELSRAVRLGAERIRKARQSESKRAKG